MSAGARERGARWLPVVGGLLFAAAYCLPLLAPNFLAFVPLLLWLDREEAARGPARLLAGFVFGLTTHLITLHFLLALLRFTWLAALLYVALAVVFALRISLTIALAGWLRRRTALPWAVLLPAAWVPFEWLQGFGDLRMTADHVAHSLAGYPFLVQFADVTGPYGVAVFLLAANGLVYDVAFPRRTATRTRSAWTLALLCGAVLVYDAWAWTRPEPAGPTLRVGIVQPDIPLLVKWDDAGDAEQTGRLAALTRRAAEQGAEVVVWPETARPRPLYHWLDRPETYALPDVQGLARELSVTIVAGVEYVRVRSRDDWELYNAALVADPAGRLSDAWTAKVHLVPFVEALPFAALLGPLLEGREFLSGGFRSGPPAGLVELQGARAGVLVCFEQLFAQLPRARRNHGAELQLVITNDAWFGRTFFQKYQADVLRLRAIENRTAFVRAANTGISGFVDRRGRYREQTRLYEVAVATETVRLSSGRTVYDRLGDVPAGLCLGTLAWAVLLAARRARRGDPFPST